MEVKINREIRDYQESIFFGLNLRQLIFSILAIAVAVGVYFGLRDLLGTETVSWLCVLAAFPFGAMGFIKYNGMTAEQFALAFIKSEMLMPRELCFEGENLYYRLMREGIENKTATTEQGDLKTKARRKHCDKNMASITKRKSKYSVVYDFYDDEGVRHQKWETWGTYAEAKKRKAEIEHKQTNNTFVKPSIKTVSELMYDFMNLYGVNAWVLSTYDGKKGLIDNYINPIIGKVKIKDITPRFMDEYYRKLLKVQRVMRNGQSFEGETVSPRNVREIHKILNCAFNQAVRWELLESNPVSKATLPKCENKVRDIWTMEDLSKALEVCEDDRLALAIHLAFSCSLRLGEIMGLTWDCLTIDEESIREHNASLFVEKELQRVSKNAMNVLENKDVLKVFPAVLVSDSTILVFKKPKTKTSIRRVWLPETVARMLVDWKKQQEEQKRYLGSEYHDYNIVLALPNGRPMEGQVISRLFNAMIRKNDLPKVVFHSLRHSSTTYKLKLNNGDMKAVQGDTGHAQLKMVSDVYSHILDEDRRYNAEKMERDFYKKAEEKVSTEPTAKPTNAATEQLMNLLNSSPDLAAQLLQMLTANQTGQAVTA